MKKISLFLIVIFSVFKIYAQAPEIDSLNKLLNTKIPDTTRIEILVKLSFYNQAFQPGLDLANKALQISKEINYKKGEAAALKQIGNQYWAISNSAAALHFYLEALRIREQIQDVEGLASSYTSVGYLYQEQGDFQKALSYYSKAQGMHSDNKFWEATFSFKMGKVYLHLNKPDSALYYFQHSYEVYNSIADKYQFNNTLNYLGDVQLGMGNNELAIAYYRQAEKNGNTYNDTLGLSETYLSMAKLYEAELKIDSSIFYAQQALFHAQHGGTLIEVIASAKLLSKLFENTNDKQALKYLQIAQIANDSLFSNEKRMQIQNLFFSETERENELIEKEKKDAEERKQNIQYALIAIGIVTFIILFFLLSRSIIVTEKWISFFGILGLLVVFEFINLFIHPFLEKAFHHSPLLMLMALVVLASLLIPFHHRLEKWIKEKMTEKNKQIRLQNAKRTIEKLEGKTGNK